MPLFAGIPVTLAMCAAMSLLVWRTGLNPYWLVALTSGVWASEDSRRVGISRSDSRLALPFVGMVAVHVIGWPFVFPWYLGVRHAVKRARLPDDAKARTRWGWWTVGAAAMALTIALGVFGLASVALSPAMKGMSAVGQALAEKYQLQLNVAYETNGTFTITAPTSAAPTDSAARRAWALEMASFARKSFTTPNTLHSIAIVLVDQSERGIVKVTRETARYVWPVDELGEMADGTTSR